MRKIPSLPHRLERIAELTEIRPTCADVGTDHGLLPIYLLETGKTEYVYASDINIGPLEAAKKNFALYSLSEKADFILCDGLKDVLKYRPDNIIIAGMGGETIAGILSGLLKAKDYYPLLYLQPMTKVEKLRAFLRKNDFKIKREILCAEDERIYIIMTAVKEAETDDESDEIFNFDDSLSVSDYIGSIDTADVETNLLKKPYFEKLLRTINKHLEGIKLSGMASSEIGLFEKISYELKRKLNETEGG